MPYSLDGRKKARAAAFTLTELVIALAILGLVATITVPIYNGFRREAAVGQAIQEIRQIELQLKDLALDGDLPATLAEAGLAMEDPWGRPYRYLAIAVTPPPDTGAVRKDKNLNPINTDFDLYSLGADGESKPPLTAKSSRDDVVRAANGSFVGLGEDY